MEWARENAHRAAVLDGYRDVDSVIVAARERDVLRAPPVWATLGRAEKSDLACASFIRAFSAYPAVHRPEQRTGAATIRVIGMTARMAHSSEPAGPTMSASRADPPLAIYRCPGDPLAQPHRSGT
jgi:hypothetical protein